MIKKLTFIIFQKGMNHIAESYYVSSEMLLSDVFIWDKNKNV